MPPLTDKTSKTIFKTKPSNIIKKVKASSREGRRLKEEMEAKQKALTEIYNDKALRLAKLSLAYFNSKHCGPAFELVKAGYYGGGGHFYHTNFEATRKDDPDAKVMTFFAQVRTRFKFVIDCCVNLGASDKLPPLDELYNFGCGVCRIELYHPERGCERLMTGWVNEESTWRFAAKKDPGS